MWSLLYKSKLPESKWVEVQRISTSVFHAKLVAKMVKKQMKTAFGENTGKFKLKEIV